MELNNIIDHQELEKIEHSILLYRRHSRLYIDPQRHEDGTLFIKATQRENRQQKYLTREEIVSRVNDVFRDVRDIKLVIEARPFENKNPRSFFLHLEPEMVLEHRGEPSYRARVVEGEGRNSFTYEDKKFHLEPIGEGFPDNLYLASRNAKKLMNLMKVDIP